MNKKRLFVVTPSYLDVESFLILRVKILESLDNAQLNFQEVFFILIDDTAGLDPEIEKLESFTDVNIIRPPFNLGHQRAIVFSLRSCFEDFRSTDIVATLDSDGEDRPEDLPCLIKKLSDKNQMVLARRTSRRETIIFKLFYSIYKIVFKLITGEVIRSGNYAVHSCENLKKIIYHPYFDLCYSSSMIALKLNKEFVPCPRGERYKGKSRMNFKSLVMHGVRMLMPFMDKIATRSLISFSTGLLFSFIAITIIFMVKILTDLAIPGWASSLITMFSILSFIAIGNFVILFTVFTQGQGQGLRSLENYNPQDIKFATTEKSL